MKTLVFLFALTVASVLSTPLNQPIEPSFDAYRDVRLLLTTRQNRNNPYRLMFRNQGNLDGSHFNPNRPTRILVHGWWEDDTSDIGVGTSEEFLALYDFNVIFVDWSEGSRTINYFGAANRVPVVGNFVASYLNWLAEINRIRWDTTQVTGFSLGAHIAGFIGKGTGSRLHTIIGLDPAGPLFSVGNPAGRIDAGDARYVECHHTNGPTLFIAGAGIGAAICDADFFPNGGEDQRGCILNTCSHLRAVDYYIESINRNGFHSVRCDSVRDANRESCTNQGGFWPSGEPSNGNIALRGIFYFRTNRNAPWGEGPWRA